MVDTEVAGEFVLVVADLAGGSRIGHCRERGGEGGTRGRHGASAGCRKWSKPISGHMFTQSADIKAQSARQVRRCRLNSSAAWWPRIVRRCAGLFAAIMERDGQGHTLPSGSIKASGCPPKQPG